MYERRHQPLASHRHFIRRLLLHGGMALLLLILSLGIGLLGYHHFENLSWLDAFLNSAMLLGGMGPVNAPASPGGQLFARVYALYAGLVFTPVMHRFHLNDEPTKQ